VFKIKICGVRRPEDLPHIAAAGADAVGLNFYPQSKRYLTADEAARVTAAVPAGIARVGVFVNAPVDLILTAAENFQLDYIQLHGDEPPETIAALEWPVIRAFQLGRDGWPPIEQYLAECKQRGVLPAAVMIDAAGPAGQYGGTGKTADWQAIADWRSHIDLPLVLAGGLTPDNVAQAIKTVRPSAIDTASGVESKDGFKDAAATRSFVVAAHACGL
jgi:phosphoribosylanthranilate isomerase